MKALLHIFEEKKRTADACAREEALAYVKTDDMACKQSSLKFISEAALWSEAVNMIKNYMNKI